MPEHVTLPRPTHRAYHRACRRATRRLRLATSRLRRELARGELDEAAALDAWRDAEAECNLAERRAAERAIERANTLQNKGNTP